MNLKFYNRENECEALQEIETLSAESSQMTVMVGRRRVGKTTLLKKAFTKTTVLYFFVAKKNEVLLCEEFSAEVSEKLGISLGSYSSFTSLFKAIMQLSESRNFTLIIDEFQEFALLNSSIFSEMQNIWDSSKDQSRINLVLCGSIYSMMRKIFEHSKEPLFGRATAKITLKPFNIATIKEILGDYNPDYSNEDLLAFYLATGGVAKYIEQLVRYKAFTKKAILNYIFKENSYFLNEGRDVLIDEFGRDYANYFSILSLIASSKTERGDIESTLDMTVGGYLEKLEKDYSIIKRIRPFGAKEGSRSNKYLIEDNFLNLWFRFIYKYRSAVEIGNMEYVRDIVLRDYDTFSGMVLEKYFRAKMIDSKEFSAIGSYWNRKGENEIDIVAVNDYQRRLVICEVKRNKSKISISQLQNKATEIVKKYADYEVEYRALSLEDM
ncbi:MAG: ATP-binding protein [Rikenellaceae bacterium]